MIMKKFNDLCQEALLITSIKPEADTSGAIQPVTNPKDMFSQTVDQFLTKQSSDDLTQPTDDVGEFGETQSDETDTNTDVQLECTPDGLRVKFNGLEIVLPKSVIEKIKAHQEHEETESPEEEAQEHETTSDESEDETDETDETETSEEKEKDSNDMFDTK